MNVLWFSHFIPFPPRGGSPQRSYNLIREAARRHDVELIALNLQGEPGPVAAAHAAELRKLCKKVDILDLPVRWKSSRWWAAFLASPARSEPYSCRALWWRELARRIQDRVQGWDGLVHVDSIDLGRFAPQVLEGPAVLNHHNCESAMLFRRVDNESNPIKRFYLRDQARKVRKLERVLCADFNVNTVVSEVDRGALREHCPTGRFVVVENGTDTHFFTPRPDEVERGTIIFSGSLKWYPNISALRFFLGRVWPLIKKQAPGTRFYVAGMKPSEMLLEELGRDPQITVVPSPEDIRPWIARGAVSICPMLDGGGTKLKVLDAMAMGKALVSTRVGCEGIEVTSGEHLVMADSPEEFADAVLRVLGDDGLRRRLERSGRAFVEERYSWDVIGTHLEAAHSLAMKSTDLAPTGA